MGKTMFYYYYQPFFTFKLRDADNLNNIIVMLETVY